MTGAAHLCARGALRGGAGLVTIALPRSLASSFSASLPESMTAALPESREGTFSEASLDPFLTLLRDKNVVAVGPGLSRHPDALSFAKRLISRLTLPAVIDADGLHALSSCLSVLMDAQTEHILTPHPGEFGRLLGISAAEVQQDRLGLARGFASKYGVVLVLKGSHSLVATPDGEVHFNLTGNAGMAAGGMGDVLTGLIASLVAQGSPPRDAARLGVFLHGRAGDAVAGTIGPRGFLATEVADRLPTVVRDFPGNSSSSAEDGGDLRLLIP
jgi:NAD(P)H-hydrate epimerase